jgi:hypothetical protein
MNKIGLNQAMKLGSVELSGANVKEALQTLTLAVAFHIKYKLLSTKVSFNIVRHALNSNSWVKAFCRQLNIFKGNTVKCSIFCKEYLSFV